MTVAIFEQKADALEIIIKGHSRYNQDGPDIVCAACSTLAYTLLECMCDIEDMGGLNEFSSVIDEKDGEFHIKLCGKPWAHSDIKGIVDTIITGFSLLQQKYPDFVKLCVRSGEK